MLSFEVNKQSDIRIAHKKLLLAAAVFCRLKKWKGEKHFSLAFVDNRIMKKLNNNYRGKDTTTDVLSFAEEFKDFVDAPGDAGYVGEIIISVPVARKQAEELKHSLEREVIRLLVHGLSHLSGYEHEDVSDKEAEKMALFEETVINKIYKT